MADPISHTQSVLRKPVAMPTGYGFRDLTGQRFGRWVVLAYADRRINVHRWHCVCDCEAKKVVRGMYLINGRSKSCGCLRREITASRKTTHGASVGRNITPEYVTRYNMINRCHSVSNKAYHRYGGRGITVCNRWRFGENGVGGFECFVKDMGLRPLSKDSIDRKNNNLGYAPDNCRWATMAEQQRNRRDNVQIEVGGRVMILTDALLEAGETLSRFQGIRKRHCLPNQEAFDLMTATPRGR